MKSSSWRSLAAASLLLTICGGCVNGRPATVETQRDLPNEPSFAKPVSVKPLAVGESCFVGYDRHRAGLAEANDRMVRFGQWYGGVRSEYARK